MEDDGGRILGQIVEHGNSRFNRLRDQRFADHDNVAAALHDFLPLALFVTERFDLNISRQRKFFLEEILKPVVFNRKNKSCQHLERKTEYWFRYFGGNGLSLNNRQQNTDKKNIAIGNQGVPGGKLFVILSFLVRNGGFSPGVQMFWKMAYATYIFQNNQMDILQKEPFFRFFRKRPVKDRLVLLKDNDHILLDRKALSGTIYA